jgi:hypothetical protein
VIVKSPTKTPFSHVLVYKHIKIFYGVVYDTRFIRRGQGIEYDANYKQFLPMKYVPQSRTKRLHYDLYDVTKGAFSGNIVIPIKDICNVVGQVFSIHIGFQGKAAVAFCKIGGHLKVTLYNLAESNKTGRFQLVLENPVPVLVQSRAEVLNGVAYTSGVSNGVIYVSAYRKENWYQPVNHFIKLSSLLRGIHSYTTKFNSQFNLLIILGFPGPRAVGLKEVYDPLHGLIKNGTSKHIFHEIMIYFDPKSADKNFHDFHFDLSGSFIHMIRSHGNAAQNKDYFKYIDVYGVV